MKTLSAIAAVTAGLGMVPAAQAQKQEAVSVTVYNQNFALVKDVRSLDLTKGAQEVRIDDVASGIDPTSVHFAALDHPGGVAVLEQNYQYDLAGADNLLNRYLNQDVNAVMKDGSLQSGKLLSFDGGSLVLSTGAGVSIINRAEVRDISVGQLPGGLVVKPTLVWMLAADRTGSERGEVSYLTNQINWHAEYVAVASADDKQIDVSGWVSVDNQSGATYPDARLKLVAGDVHRVQEPRYPEAPRMQKMAMDAVGGAQFESRDFFEYHIYTLERPATIADRETKQLSLFPSARTPVRKILTYDGATRADDVTVELEFTNSQDHGLGMPLPAGKVRVYKKDEDGALEFVGEDQIDHTPKDEKVRIYLGNAFDVKGERTQTNFRKLSDRSGEETYQIKLRNHKKEAVTVVVVEHFRGDWRISGETHPYTKKDSRTAEFEIAVPVDGEVTVGYTVTTTW